jgi:outer membrane immunogenic protein
MAGDPFAYTPERGMLNYDWSGIYVGGHAGGVHAATDWTFTAPTEAFDQSRQGFIGGAQAGVQKQWGGLVLGAEVAYAWTSLEESSQSILDPGTSRTSDINNLLLVTGKLGAAYENMLGYAKAGWASADVELRSSITGGPVTTTSSGRENGWTAGVGFDYGLTPNISIGVEYDYVRLAVGDRDQIPTPSGVAGNRVTEAGVDMQMLVARLNFKFGGARPEPVPMK